MTESEIEDQCDELFREAPIDFKPRKFSEIDQIIAGVIEQNDVVIPIQHIEDNYYLIGSSKVDLSLNGDTVYVQKGMMNVKLQDYINDNNMKFQKKLVLKMI